MSILFSQSAVCADNFELCLHSLDCDVLENFIGKHEHLSGQFYLFCVPFK